MTLGRGRDLVPEFIRSLLTLVVYNVVLSLPLGGVGKDFPFSEDEDRVYSSELPSTLRESLFEMREHLR